MGLSHVSCQYSRETWPFVIHIIVTRVNISFRLYDVGLESQVHNRQVWNRESASVRAENVIQGVPLKRPITKLLATLAVTAGLAQVGGARAEPVVSDFTLDNGMRAVVIEDHRAPVVTHMVWYKVGSADEPPGKTGIAHYLEHLMFKGTEKIAPGQFSRIIAQNGGQDNAFTSRDYTAYFQRIAKDRLGLVMGMEADRMRNVNIRQEDIVAERDVVIEERNSRTDSTPSGRFREQFNAALYLNHAYGKPVIGWREEIEALDRDDALVFYERFYAPNNATLIVAGDVTPDEVRKLADEHYAPIEPVDLPENARTTEPPHLAARRIVMRDARVAQPSLSRSYLAPSYVTDKGNVAESLSLLSDILSGAPSRRLNKMLTLDTDLALYAGAYYSGMARDMGEFGFYAAPKGDTTMPELEGAIDWMIAELLENGVTEEELARAKKAAISSQIFAADSQSSLARRYGAALTIGLELEEIQNWRERIESVTVDDVMEAARTVLVPARSVTGYLMKTKEGAEG